MTTTRGHLGALAVATALTVVAVWTAPPVGLIATAVLLVLLPPWGRSLTERAVVSGLVVLGIVAVVFPRAGATPVTSTSARLLVTILLAAVLALRLIPALRDTRIPRPSLSDGIALVLGAASAWWLMAAYVGASTTQIVSNLFFSGWDNHAHFTTFANTYEAASTTWPTIDGSVAWNQWYPSLHSTTWALLELAWRPVSPLLTRPELLWPYVQWSAITFATCMVALAWVAGDLAARIGGRDRERWARPLAVGLFALFALLGTPAYLFNAGFTNFVLGVTVVITAAYLSARSLRSARVLGWFLVPLAAIAVIGLWTPLVLGLVPSGVVVAYALIRFRWWVGAAWLAAVAAVGAVLAVTQTAAILGVEPGQGGADLTSDLGAVSTGMVPFPLGIALLAPIIVVLVAALLIRMRRWPLAVALLGPTLGFGAVALIFLGPVDTAGISRLQAYYILKPLDAMVMSLAPLLAALVAVVVMRAVDRQPRMTRGLAVATAVVIVAGLFGYAGVLTTFEDGGAPAAGVQAGADRTRGRDSLVGEAIIRAQEAALPYPDRATLLWDGAGTLPNLWVMSLHGVLSKIDQTFYKGLPEFPYDTRALGYVDLTLQTNPTLNLAALWFRPSTGELFDAYVAGRNDQRVIAVKVPMPPNDLCPECSP
ncbi:MAG: hypothetical protein GC156_12000 [Actinomycetales bacterium]|nr:hypothetical protein [Actinomycetales bacterium]